MLNSYKPMMTKHHLSLVVRKPAFCICENKDTDQLAVTAKLISAFVFATRIVQYLLSLNTKFQASSHLLRLYSPVCVGPGRKPRRPVFSQRGLFTLVLEDSLSLFLCINHVLPCPHPRKSVQRIPAMNPALRRQLVDKTCVNLRFTLP